MITADLRSDTVTKPTPEMLACMMQAEVGDDVFGEDPSINSLEKKAAEMLGMRSMRLKLFLPFNNIFSPCYHLIELTAYSVRFIGFLRSTIN